MNDSARRLLEDLLDREIDLAGRLDELLAAERIALIGTSPAEVTTIAARKCEIFAELERMEVERRDLCAAAEEPLPPFGSTADGAVAARWRALLAVMRKCRRANEVNGHIIHLRQGQVRQLLQIVRGAPALTYGPHGKTFTTALRALAQA
jgi:flagella synthesis protein FlgN